jgi:hypothetical protein
MPRALYHVASFSLLALLNGFGLAAPATAATCNGVASILYPNPPAQDFQGTVDHVELSIGTQSIQSADGNGTGVMVVSKVFFDLSCRHKACSNSAPGFAVPCKSDADCGAGNICLILLPGTCVPDGSLSNTNTVVGFNGITFTNCTDGPKPAGSNSPVTFSVNNPGGGSASPNEVVFTPSSPMHIPANTTSFCTIRFDVVKLADRSFDDTPTLFEERGGFLDGQCDNGLAATGLSNGSLQLSSTPTPTATGTPKWSMVATPSALVGAIRWADRGAMQAAWGMNIVNAVGLEICLGWLGVMLAAYVLRKPPIPDHNKDAEQPPEQRNAHDNCHPPPSIERESGMIEPPGTELPAEDHYQELQEKHWRAEKEFWEKQLRTARRLNCFTLLAAVAGILGIIILICTLRNQSRQVDETFRPVLAFDNPPAEPPPVVSPSEGGGKGSTTWGVTYSNEGKGPALYIQVLTGHRFGLVDMSDVDRGVPLPVSPNDRILRGMHNPGRVPFQVEVSEEELPGLDDYRRGGFVSIWFILLYDDQALKHHETGMCIAYRQNAFWRPCNGQWWWIK